MEKQAKMSSFGMFEIMFEEFKGVVFRVIANQWPI